MVQHAARLDDVEGPADRAELEDVGLRIFEIGHAQFAGLAQRVGKAGQAEIDRQRARTGKARRGLDRVLPGAAARNQDIELDSCRGCGRWRPGICCACTGRTAPASSAGRPSPSADRDFPRTAAAPCARHRPRSASGPGSWRAVPLPRPARVSAASARRRAPRTRSCPGARPRPAARAADSRSRPRRARSSGMAAPDASAAATLSRNCRAAAASSSVNAKTCSLTKHCRASAQAKSSTFGSTGDDASAAEAICSIAKRALVRNRSKSRSAMIAVSRRLRRMRSSADGGEPRRAEQFLRRQPARPGVHRALDAGRRSPPICLTSFAATGRERR